jgi:hypothetical protein
MRKLLILTWLLPVAASADLIAPDEAECDGKQRGAPCAAPDGAGTCQDDRCCRNDYSQGTPPRTVCSPCLRCKAGAPPPSTGPTPPPTGPTPPPTAPRQFAPPPPSSGRAVEAVPGPAPASGRKAADPAAASVPEGAPAPTPPPTKTGCLAAPGAPGGLGLGALLGGGLLALGLARSRRRG